LAKRHRLRSMWESSPIADSTSTLILAIGESGQRLVIQPSVLHTFANHRQLRSDAPEAGGQLFARIDGPSILLELATGPRQSDRRSRYSYQPDRRAEQEEIDRLHRESLLFVGDWHTHPEPIPHPSSQDLASIRESVAKSKHHLNGFLLIIVGTGAMRTALWVGLHSTTESLQLAPPSHEHSEPMTNVGVLS
jgi:integrative and conjugative element protein (TIGR02256 family)